MARNINRFIRELAEYINTYIVGSENTYITQCVPLDKIFNRGHAILMNVRMPEHIAENFKGMGPTFYAEELMSEFSNSTIAAIAEIVNIRTTEHYPVLIKMLENQEKIIDKTIDDYDKKDLILTALPSSQVPENLNSSIKYVTKELPKLGLTVTMKGCTHSESGNDEQSYFVPVNKDEKRDITKDEWELAENNSMNSSDIYFRYIPVPAQVIGENDIPVCGQITDMNQFYDYFYLLSVKKVWSSVTKKSNADRLYIMPYDAYTAMFIIDNQAVRKNQTAQALRNIFVKAYMKNSDKIMPIFALDCDTFEITKLDNMEFGKI